jgi:hypothetical protein
MNLALHQMQIQWIVFDPTPNSGILPEKPVMQITATANMAISRSDPFAYGVELVPPQLPEPLGL